MYNSIGVVLSKLSLKMCNCALIKTQDLCYYPVVGFPNWHVEGGFLISHEDVKINSKKYGIIESSDYLAKNIINNKSFSQFDLCFNGSVVKKLVYFKRLL